MTTTVSTDNWDTAFGIRFADANAAILAANSSPASFTGTHTVVGASYQVTASFGAWQMTGGSGSLLTMTLPLTDGWISGGTETALFAGSAVVQVSLGFVPQPGSTTVRDLTLDAGTGVSVLSVTLTAGPPSARDTVRGALNDWLAAHLDEFTHVFAAVDLNTSADVGEFAWLQPTHLGYALHTEGIDHIGDYVFGVLAMTDHRPGSRLSPVLDPAVIPSGSDAGFLIAADRIIETMFRPDIETLFKNATAEAFDTLDDGMTLYNISPVGLPDFTLSDGTNITDARVDSAGFRLEIGTGAVIVSFTGMTFTYKTGYTVTVNYRSVNRMATDDTNRLELTPTGSPTVSMAISESSGEKWKEIWEGIGIALAGAVVGAVLGAAAEAALATRAAVQAGVDAAAETGSELVEIEMDEIGDEVSEVDKLKDELASLKSAVTSLQKANAPMAFSGFFRANLWKLLGAAIGAAVGASVGSIPAILNGYADENRDKVPTLDEFAARAIGSTTWAASSGYTMNSAVLHGALQLGLTKVKV